MQATVSPPKLVRERLWPAVGIVRHFLVILALMVLVGTFFSNSYRSGMTLDNRYIIEEYYRSLTNSDASLDLKSGRQMGLIFKNDYWSPKGISGLYRPLTVLSYWLDYAVFNAKAPKVDDDFHPVPGADGKPIPADNYAAMSWKDYANAPGHLPVNSYHTINLLTHWLNASLLYFLCLATLKRFWPAALAAALFATHPIVVESVTNIIGRADLFAGLTVFGGLLIYVRSTVSLSFFGRVPWLFGLMLIVAFGLFSKESSIAVGIIVPLYWLIFRCDWKQQIWSTPNPATRANEEKPAYAFAASWNNPFWRKAMIELAAWSFMLLPLIGMLYARHAVFAATTPAEEPFLDNPIRGIGSIASLHLPSFEQQLRDRPVLGVSFIECRITAVKVLGKLLGLLVWPVTLCSDYSYSQIPNFSWKLFRWEDWQALVAVAMFAAIGGITWRLWKRDNKPAVFWIVFFFCAALPTANLVYAIGSIMAERFMYVPLAGFAVALSMIVFTLCEQLAPKLAKPNLVRWAPVSLLGFICLAYGMRTFSRNRVWKDDQTLWTDAIQHAPLSFRCHQSLAFALYERKDMLQHVDEMIELDSTARPIVDNLPDHLNSARLYLHLGMYLSLKGDSLLKHNPDNTLQMTEGARDYFNRAIETLSKGAAVDRAFNEQIRARQERRGDPEDKITDMGLSPVYGTMAICQARLGHVTDALNSIQYQRQLDPAEVDSYRKEAVICMDSGRFDQAAIALVQAILINSSDGSYWNALSQVYSRLANSKDALVIQNGAPRFNLSHPLMRQHLIAAYSRFVRDTRRAHRLELAHVVHDAAINQFGLPAELFNNLMKEPIAVCTPQGIQPDQIDFSCKPLE